MESKETIMNGLEHCEGTKVLCVCDSCPYDNEEKMCHYGLASDARKLIKEQDRIIEELKSKLLP